LYVEILNFTAESDRLHSKIAQDRPVSIVRGHGMSEEEIPSTEIRGDDVL